VATEADIAQLSTPAAGGAMRQPELRSAAVLAKDGYSSRGEVLPRRRPSGALIEKDAGLVNLRG